MNGVELESETSLNGEELELEGFDSLSDNCNPFFPFTGMKGVSTISTLILSTLSFEKLMVAHSVHIRLPIYAMKYSCHLSEN